MPVVDPSLDSKNYHGVLNLPRSARRVLKASPRVLEVETPEQLHYIAQQYPEVRNCNGELLGVLHKPNGGGLSTFNAARQVDMARVGNAITVGDNRPSDMQRFEEIHGVSFPVVREYILTELEKADLLFFVVPYEDQTTGQTLYVACIARVVDAPVLLAIAELQGILTFEELKDKKIENVFFLETSFRERHCKDEMQAAVHYEADGCNEVFTNMVYGGPQKKGSMGICIAASFTGKGRAVKHCSSHWNDARAVHPTLLDVISRLGALQERLFAGEGGAKLRALLELLREEAYIGWVHEAISGGAKSEIWLALHRLITGHIELAVWGRRADGGFYTPQELKSLRTPKKLIWDLRKELELIAHAAIDDIGLTALRDNWIYMSDAERRKHFVRLDHADGPGANPGLEDRYHHPWSRGHFLNMRLGPQGIRIWEQLNSNSRVFDDKSKIPNIELGAVKIHVNSYGVRVPAGDALSLVSKLCPCSYLSWWACSPQLAQTPSFTITDAEFPNEGAGTMGKFNPGSNEQLIEQRIQEMRATHSVTGMPIYVLIPVGWVGNWYFGYNAPQAARQIVCHNLPTFVADVGLVDSIHPLLGRFPKSGLGAFDGSAMLPAEVFDLAQQDTFGEEGVQRGLDRILPWFENLIPKRMLKHPNRICREAGQAVLDRAPLAERLAIWGLSK